MAEPLTYWIPANRQKGYVTSTTQTASFVAQNGSSLVDQNNTTQYIMNPNMVIGIENTQWTASEV